VVGNDARRSSFSRIEGVSACTKNSLGRDPIYALAETDRIVDNRAMRRWFAAVASRRKTLIEFGEASHTFEFDERFDDVFAAVLEWIIKRESPGGATPGL
jgi:hypothetical protein